MGLEIAAERLAVRLKFVSIEFYSKQTFTICRQTNLLERNKVDYCKLCLSIPSPRSAAKISRSSVFSILRRLNLSSYAWNYNCSACRTAPLPSSELVETFRSIKQWRSYGK